ncbi:conserved hypothetical protein [Culex quinquefasciatus]|uniref:Uncharacterized protein n=1 Tax=Culex quinquefasciatus TaxID=7176 RepID=B0W102_CULQU|nr:conserved hypothetical protein [Culex quinquefasciatus]|eukprot:XP_001842386.1 conserved hypothetical protein [Culex quinquefasciatus]
MKRTVSGRATRPVVKESIIESGSSGDENDEYLMDTYVGDPHRSPDENPAKYCRLCFSIAQPLEPVFNGPHDQGGHIAQLIRESMNVSLTAREDHPCAICRECFQRLHEFQRFRSLFHTLNQVVRRKKNTQRAVLAKKAKKKAKVSTAAASAAVPIVDSTTNGPPELPAKGADCIELSDEDDDNPVVSNGPSAETAEDMDDDQPYIALDDDWFCCRLCNRMFQTLAVMIDHLRDIHPGTVNVYQMPPGRVSGTDEQSNIMSEVMSGGVRFFKCNDCDTMLRQKSNMFKHWTRFHKDGAMKKLHCGVEGCTRFFMDSKSYRRHLTIHHGITDPSKILKYQMQQS